MVFQKGSKKRALWREKAVKKAPMYGCPIKRSKISLVNSAAIRCTDHARSQVLDGWDTTRAYIVVTYIVCMTAGYGAGM